ncbi:MAG: family 1 glycosylhydrolase [Chloroflexi bacterium]|nr:family 1 glycosylhydrolase [Chloroflexota bacterium]
MSTGESEPPFLAFPPGFFWGAAVSAHQTEGENTSSDWWAAEQAGTVPHCSGRACDSWNRWPDDVASARDLNLSALRLSVEWARIEPEPGCFSQPALDHYRRVIECVRKAGLEPIVTLHHTTNPLWLAERGAWTSSEVVPRFAEYADRVGRALGDLVEWWVTINEPTVSGIFGYLTGLWPPHRHNAWGLYLRHASHCLRGHAAARAALRGRHGHARASMALHINPLDPLNQRDPTDWAAVRIYDWLWQGLFLQLAAPHLDWVGINYYFRLLVRWDLLPWSLFAPPHMGTGEKTEFNWEIYPEGLYRVLQRVGRLHKPVIITENGIADADDDQRPRYIVEHLRQAHRAIRDGVDLRGYVHWSLLDNFEWAEGYTKRFGLLSVDFATQVRTPRPSARIYASIARANGLGGQIVRRAHERSTGDYPPGGQGAVVTTVGSPGEG